MRPTIGRVDQKDEMGRFKWNVTPSSPRSRSPASRRDVIWQQRITQKREPPAQRAQRSGYIPPNIAYSDFSQTLLLPVFTLLSEHGVFKLWWLPHNASPSLIPAKDSNL